MTKALYIAISEYVKKKDMLPVKRRISVSGILKKIGVSRSSYSAWKRHTPSNAEIHHNKVKEKITEIYDTSHQNYGAPKITIELQKAGESISEKSVGNYVRQMGIKVQWIKMYIQTTIDSDFSDQLKNILNEKFYPERPDAMWCSDITYIWIYEGFVYLTSVMDLYSRKIISWKLSDTLETIHVVECIENAKKIRKIQRPLIFHCNRGAHYVSTAFKQAMKGMINSYSKKSYLWDNACIESFNSFLKIEWIHRFKILNYVQAYKLVFEYIETFYNTVHIHSHCEYLSPNQYEQEYYRILDERATKMES